MTCGSCGRRTRIDRLPRGWKACGTQVYCPLCRRRRFRIRSITMVVAEPIRAEWEQFRLALEETWRRSAPLFLTAQAWQLTTVGGRHVARVFVGNQWWALRLDDSQWSGGRRAAYEKIAASQAATPEFLVFRRPTYEKGMRYRPSRELRPYEIACKAVAWLPREQPDQANPKVRS